MKKGRIKETARKDKHFTSNQTFIATAIYVNNKRAGNEDELC